MDATFYAIFACSLVRTTLPPSNPSYRDLPPHTPPKVAPPLQRTNPHISKPISLDNKLLPSLSQLGDAWDGAVGEFMCVGIAGLEEGGEGACVALVESVVQTIWRAGLLDGVYLIPLDMTWSAAGVVDSCSDAAIR